MMYSNFGESCFDFRERFDGYGGFGDMMGGFGWFGMIFNVLFGLGLLVLAVVLIIWLVRRAGRGHMSMTQQGPSYPPFSGSGTNFRENDSASALRILNERYARGEINEEEYLKIKKNLS